MVKKKKKGSVFCWVVFSESTFGEEQPHQANEAPPSPRGLCSRVNGLVPASWFRDARAGGDRASAESRRLIHGRDVTVCSEISQSFVQKDPWGFRSCSVSSLPNLGIRKPFLCPRIPGNCMPTFRNVPVFWDFAFLIIWTNMNYESDWDDNLVLFLVSQITALSPWEDPASSSIKSLLSTLHFHSTEWEQRGVKWLRRQWPRAAGLDSSSTSSPLHGPFTFVSAPTLFTRC